MNNKNNANVGQNASKANGTLRQDGNQQKKFGYVNERVEETNSTKNPPKVRK